MSLKEMLQEECKVAPNPEKVDETIRMAKMAMKHSDPLPMGALSAEA